MSEEQKEELKEEETQEEPKEETQEDKDWRAMRSENKRLKEEVAALQPKEEEPKQEPAVDPDHIRRETKKVLLEEKKTELMANVPDDKKEQVQFYLDKFEPANSTELKTYFDAASRAAGVEAPAPSYPGSGGVPKFKSDEKKEDFAETDKGKGLASALNLNFPKVKE